MKNTFNQEDDQYKDSKLKKIYPIIDEEDFEDDGELDLHWQDNDFEERKNSRYVY